MANPGYVRSTDGNNADNGSTWALANADFSGAIADAVAGDTIYVSQSHNGTYAAATTLTFPGTRASPNLIIGGNDAAAPPTSTSNAWTEQTSGASSYTFVLAGSFYCYGGRFKSSSSSSGSTALQLASGDQDAQVFDNCFFELTANSANVKVTLGSSSAATEAVITLIDCYVKFINTGQGISISASRKCRWTGGGIEAGSSAITTFCPSVGSGNVFAELSNLDLSAGASTMNLLPSGIVGSGSVVFSRCKLPASWSGSLVAGAPSLSNFRASMYNCDSGDTNYRLWIETFSGSIRDETTLVRTGGASDGTTTISWKMATNADADEYVSPLESDNIAIWNDTTGSSKTVTIEVLHDSATALTNAEIWAEVSYLGTSGVPLGSSANDHRALLASAANQTTSAATWTTTGMTNPNKQKLEVTFTPQEKGFFIAKVYLAKASYTVYVDPKLTVS